MNSCTPPTLMLFSLLPVFAIPGYKLDRPGLVSGALPLSRVAVPRCETTVSPVLSIPARAVVREGDEALCVGLEPTAPRTGKFEVVARRNEFLVGGSRELDRTRPRWVCGCVKLSGRVGETGGHVSCDVMHANR